MPPGARQGEGSPTRTPVLVGFGPTLFSLYRKGKRGRRGRGTRRRKGGWCPLPKSNSASSLMGGAPAPCGLVSLPPMAHKAHIFPRGVPVTPPVLRMYPIHSRTLPVSEYYLPIYHRYLSTISRLLVMSVISSGTPNNLQSPKHITHNTNRHRTLSVRTLRVRELC